MSNEQTRFGQANTGEYCLYYPITVKGGDTLTNPTTKSYFQSLITFNPGRNHAGERFDVYFRGAYMIPTGTIGPTAQPFLEFGPTTGALNTVATVPTPLTVGIGTGIEFGFYGHIVLIVMDGGPTGSLRAGGELTFQTSGGATPGINGLVIATNTTTVNFEQANTLRLAVVTTPSAATCYFRLDDLHVRAVQKPVNAN